MMGIKVYPDLPGCLSVADTMDELGPMAESARVSWISSMYDNGNDIPLPSYPEEYSGKFNVRLPRSLHRKLAETAQREGVSLNTHVISLLERGQAQTTHDDDLLQRVEALLEERVAQPILHMNAQLSAIHTGLSYRSAKVPQPSSSRERFRIVGKEVAA